MGRSKKMYEPEVKEVERGKRLKYSRIERIALYSIGVESYIREKSQQGTSNI